MFANIHMRTIANDRLITWLVSRAMLWSAAENSVTRPTPTIASAAASNIESMRRVSTSQIRAIIWNIGRVSPRWILIRGQAGGRLFRKDSIAVVVARTRHVLRGAGLGFAEQVI